MISPKVILSGGGTGGHIFPAVSLAQEIQKRFPNAEFLFVGALGKMEMQKIPELGFKIEGLDITGFNRKNLFSNLSLPFKLLKSINKVKKIIKDFKPDFAIGTGGYASGPAMWAANSMNIPVFIQEQNSFPGITNLILSKKAKIIFTAYKDMEKHFPNNKVKCLGNPIRKDIISGKLESEKAKEKLGLQNKLTILSVGGSQGSKILNDTWKLNLENLYKKDYQLIWQTGKTEYRDIVDNYSGFKENILITEFINNMNIAYSAADVIVSRAGAIAISELALIEKPVILVPLPTAAEDHQTKNAQKLVSENAAFMIKDSEMKDDFWKILTEICDNKILREKTSNNIKKFAKPNSTEQIVNEILKTIGFQ